MVGGQRSVVARLTQQFGVHPSPDDVIQPDPNPSVHKDGRRRCPLQGWDAAVVSAGVEKGGTKRTVVVSGKEATDEDVTQ